MKKILLIISTLFILQSCSEDPTIQRIKDGTFNNCNKATIDDLVDNFFDYPSWTAIVASDGSRYVNLAGGMTYDGVPVDALVQFTAPMYDSSSFEINAFEMNDIPQNQLMVGALVTAMCNEY
tara:strand:- start:464 stop:829 length:366 start_codon:yes stop_codon:yes gene_type:complete